RWKRPDIKSVSLLANVLAKQEAADADAYEAWFIDEKGFITEGTSSNAWIVDADGALRTRPLSRDILAGITRETLIRLAREAGVEVKEEPFTLAEAQKAREAFTTSTTVGVMPVVEIDGRPIANGAPGSISGKLLRLYREHLARFAPDPERALARMLKDAQELA
ncbi:MAG: aminotransferase class IV, partial [Alphaproteobacteria bacterium]|nr:aminotransferase class IV [Alphaproteobacteria bacterium]